MTFFVKTITGKTMEFDYESDLSIYNLKGKIRDREGIDIDLQRLVFKGQILDNHLKLDYYDIKADDSLYLIVSQNQLFRRSGIKYKSKNRKSKNRKSKNRKSKSRKSKSRK